MCSGWRQFALALVTHQAAFVYMYEGLWGDWGDDLAAAPAVPPPAVPAPAAAGAAAPVIGLQTMKIRLGRAKQLQAQMRGAKEKLERIVSPSQAQKVSRVFAPATNASSSSNAPAIQDVVVGGQILTSILPLAQDDQLTTKTLDRACVSYVRAQADGIGRMITEDTCESIWTTNTMDDATMWIARPPPRQDTCTSRVFVFQLSLARWGSTRYVNLTQLNRIMLLLLRPDHSFTNTDFMIAVWFFSE